MRSIQMITRSLRLTRATASSSSVCQCHCGGLITTLPAAAATTMLPTAGTVRDGSFFANASSSSPSSHSTSLSGSSVQRFGNRYRRLSMGEAAAGEFLFCCAVASVLLWAQKRQLCGNAALQQVPVTDWRG